LANFFLEELVCPKKFLDPEENFSMALFSIVFCMGGSGFSIILFFFRLLRYLLFPIADSLRASNLDVDSRVGGTSLLLPKV
jgi:hypothetical protein